MPHLHKTFRHFSSKIPSGSRFKILTGSSEGSSWRRLFGKSSRTTSEGSSGQKLFDSKQSGSVAPHIGTLNMTRASFSSAAEKELPRIPSPMFNKYKSDIMVRKPVPSPRVGARDPSGKIEDPEKGTTATQSPGAPTRAWQRDQCKLDDQSNATIRAQYDLFPRT